jgi:hypothetical protein
VITERHASAAVALLIPAGLLGLLAGQNAVPLVVAAGLGVGVVLWARRGVRAVEGSWDGPSAAVTPATRPARGSIARALGQVEARELAYSPWFHAGVGFCVLFLVAITSFERGWWSSAGLLPLMVHPLCGLTIVGVHRNVTRSRRDGLDELFESCPATPEDRRRGHLLTSTVPASVAAVWATVLLVGAALVLDGMYGPIDGRVAADVAVTIVLPVGAVALGVLVGRIAPWLLAPFVALGVITFVNLEFWDEPDGRGWLSTGRTSGVDPVFVQPPSLGQVLWIGAITAIVAAVAIGPWRRGRRALVVAGASVVALAGVSLVALSPGDAHVERLAGYATGDRRFSDCHDLAGLAELCVPQPYADHGERMAASLLPVAAAVPASAAVEPMHLGFLPDDIDSLQADVRDRVGEVAPPEGFIDLPLSHHQSAMRVARFTLAAALVGVELGPDAPENVLLDGEARGVVLLWLATRGLDDAQVSAVLTPADRSSPTMRGHIWPGTCGADLQWAPQDVAAARALVAADDQVVSDVLAAHWGQWTSPSTRTDDLLIAVRLAPVGTPDSIDPLGKIC